MCKLFILLAIAGFIACSHEFSESASLNGPTTSDDCWKSPVRFVEVKNWQKSPNLREIVVFVDPSGFSEANLKSLFEHFSRMYPEPKLLNVLVKTDWAQLDLPTDCPPTGFGGGKEVDDSTIKFHTARYHRRGNDIYFYYTKDVGTGQMEKVVISEAGETER